jgi:hypothetical protein
VTALTFLCLALFFFSFGGGGRFRSPTPDRPLLRLFSPRGRWWLQLGCARRLAHVPVPAHLDRPPIGTSPKLFVQGGLVYLLPCGSPACHSAIPPRPPPFAHQLGDTAQHWTLPSAQRGEVNPLELPELVLPDPVLPARPRPRPLSSPPQSTSAEPGLRPRIFRTGTLAPEQTTACQDSINGDTHLVAQVTSSQFLRLCYLNLNCEFPSIVPHEKQGACSAPDAARLSPTPRWAQELVWRELGLSASQSWF